jgi:hypothetical protein
MRLVYTPKYNWYTLQNAIGLHSRIRLVYTPECDWRTLQNAIGIHRQNAIVVHPQNATGVHSSILGVTECDFNGRQIWNTVACLWFSRKSVQERPEVSYGRKWGLLYWLLSHRLTLYSEWLDAVRVLRHPYTTCRLAAFCVLVAMGNVQQCCTALTCSFV